MRRRSIIAALLLAALLCACSQRSAQMGTQGTTVQATEVSESTIETGATQNEVQPVFQWQDTKAHNKFRKTLQTIHDTLYLPNLTYYDKIDLWEPGTIEDEHFAVLDVDADGEDELLIRISNTYIAGMCTVVYGYDSTLDDVRGEACTYVAAKFYPGMIRVDASHSHGHAGDVLWPYSILIYDEEKDAYQDAFYVDAWSKEIADFDSYLQMPYPEEIDTEHDGFVYLITENEQMQIINRRDYEAWETEMFLQKEPLIIPWQKMTSENI